MAFCPLDQVDAVGIGLGHSADRAPGVRHFNAPVQRRVARDNLKDQLAVSLAIHQFYVGSNFVGCPSRERRSALSSVGQGAHKLCRICCVRHAQMFPNKQPSGCYVKGHSAGKAKNAWISALWASSSSLLGRRIAGPPPFRAPLGRTRHAVEGGTGALHPSLKSVQVESILLLFKAVTVVGPKLAWPLLRDFYLITGGSCFVPFCSRRALRA